MKLDDAQKALRDRLIAAAHSGSPKTSREIATRFVDSLAEQPGGFGRTAIRHLAVSGAMGWCADWRRRFPPLPGRTRTGIPAALAAYSGPKLTADLTAAEVKLKAAEIRAHIKTLGRTLSALEVVAERMAESGASTVGEVIEGRAA